MSVIDLLILAIVAAACFQGLRRGLIGQIGSIAAIVVAIIGCRMFGDLLQGCFSADHPELARLLSNAVVYVVLYVAVMLVARVLKFAVHAVMLGALDRIAGVAFALFKWVVGLSVALNALFAIAPSARPRNSIATDAVTAVAPWLWGVYQDYANSDNHTQPSNTNDHA